jgi:hypothetical protein
MGWTTYVDAFVLRSHRRYYLQRVDEHNSADHPVLRDAAGRFALYPNEAAAREAAGLRGEPLSEQPVEVLDFDAVSTWCSHPSADTLDRRLLMIAWHTLIHFGALEEMPNALDPTEPDYSLTQVVDRLHLTAEDAAELLGRREWLPSEVELLANVISDGIARLAIILSECETQSGAQSRAD